MAFADRLELLHAADAIDVAGDQVAAEAVGQAQGLFEVHLARGVEADGAVEGFAGDVEADDLAVLGDDGEAHAVVGDAVAELDVVEIKGAHIDGQAHAVFKGRDAQDAAGGGNDSGEHGIGLTRGETAILARFALISAPA